MEGFCHAKKKFDEDMALVLNSEKLGGTLLLL